jgi:hypothetical protein
MKKVVLLVLFVFLLGSCKLEIETGLEAEAKRETTYRKRLETMGVSVFVQEVDGCEYVVASKIYSDSGVAIVHHGNCKNPIHTNR